MPETHILCKLCQKVNQVSGSRHLTAFGLSGKQEPGRLDKLSNPRIMINLTKPVPGLSLKVGMPTFSFNLADVDIALNIAT